MLGFGRMLGLAVSERSIIAAEAGMVRGRATLLRAAQFAMPDGPQPPDWAQTGKALRRFLRRQGFAARRCWIGLEAGWLIAKEVSLPPAGADDIAGMLSIAAEREFSSAAGALVADYVAPAKPSVETPVLLVGASRQKLDAVLAMARSAGLAVAGVGCSALALASAGPADQAERLTVCLSADGAELVLQSLKGLRAIRRLTPLARGGPEGLADELRRFVSLLPETNGASKDRQLLLWDGANLQQPVLDLLRQRLQMPVRVCRFPADLGLAAPKMAGLDQPWAAQAAALAQEGLARRSAGVDFLNSRLARPRKVNLRRYVTWAAAAAAVLLAAGIWLALDLRSSRRQLERLEDQLSQLRPSAAQARTLVDNVSFARGWYDRRPGVMEPLRELTMVFPERGRIWATSVSLDGRKAVLCGKSAGEKEVLEVLDRLKAVGQFADVKPLRIRQAGAATREVSFAISFDLVGAE